MINPALRLPRGELESFCRRHRIKTLSLFGSATRQDFGPESDVDLLVEFVEGTPVSLFDIVEMQEELSAMTGRPVDLVERRGVEHSENYIRRKHILSTAETLYVER